MDGKLEQAGASRSPRSFGELSSSYFEMGTIDVYIGKQHKKVRALAIEQSAIACVPPTWIRTHFPCPRIQSSAAAALT